MIWRPKPGMRVQIRYKDRDRLYHGRTGTVITAGAGKIVNVLVLLDDGHKTTIPRGNLVELKEQP